MSSILPSPVPPVSPAPPNPFLSQCHSSARTYHLPSILPLCFSRVIPVFLSPFLFPHDDLVPSSVPSVPTSSVPPPCAQGRTFVPLYPLSSSNVIFPCSCVRVPSLSVIPHLCATVHVLLCRLFPCFHSPSCPSSIFVLLVSPAPVPPPPPPYPAGKDVKCKMTSGEKSCV